MRHAFRAPALAAAALATHFVPPAAAQLIVANTAPDQAWHVDVTDGTAMRLFDGPGIVALAVDPDGQVIYALTGAQLAAWPYGSLQPPQLLPAPSGAPLGLAWAKGELYGATSAGIQRFDLATGNGTVVLPGPLPLIGGLAYNPDDGLFYATVDSPFAGNPPGVYSLDVLGTGALVFVTPYPNGTGDYDGCAVGDGKVWIVKDLPASPLENYDLATGTWDPNPWPGPLTAGSIFSAGGWAPRFYVPKVYCTAKVNSLGCLPAISAEGWPSATANSGFTITAVDVRNQRPGVLLYSIGGRGATPFSGGTLCLAPGLHRTPPRLSGGSHPLNFDCSGVYRLDMNQFAAGNAGGTPIAALQHPGTIVNCQWWGRDPGFAPPDASTLTDAVEYVVGK